MRAAVAIAVAACLVFTVADPVPGPLAAGCTVLLVAAAACWLIAWSAAAAN